MTDPVQGPFHWPDSREAAMVPERDAVMQRLAAKFGPLKSLSSLTQSKPNVSSLGQLVAARNSGRLLMIVDTETHRDNDSRGNRWKAGDVYDIAVTIVDWNGRVLWSKRWLNRWGKLTKLEIQEVAELLRSRPDCLLCCWGNAEFKLFKQAGRKPSDGSDGIDVREWNVRALRRVMGLVQQEPALFAESIAYNIGCNSAGTRTLAFHACSERPAFGSLVRQTGARVPTSRRWGVARSRERSGHPTCVRHAQCMGMVCALEECASCNPVDTANARRNKTRAVREWCPACCARYNVCESAVPAGSSVSGLRTSSLVLD